jgi:hypothetical protein
VTFIPTFTVGVKGVPLTTAINSQALKAGWKSVVSTDLPDDWASAVITSSFNDNFDKSQTIVVIKKGVPTAASALFDARVENNKLFLSTR